MKRKANHAGEGFGEITLEGLPRGRSTLLQRGPGGFMRFMASRCSPTTTSREAAQWGIATTQSSILNALPAHIALVDREGTILAVNDGWREFGARNGLQIDAFGLGQSYLEVCDRAEGDSSEHAREAADGLRAVLRGETRAFSLDYPCHSPSERRWFRLMVNGLDGGEGSAVVMHVDLTERILTEEALRASEKQFSGAFDSAAIGVALVGLDGRWLRVNRALCHMLGYSEDELLSRTFSEITHPDDLKADLEHARQLLDGEVESYQMEKRYIHRRGHHVWVLLTGSIVRDEQGKPVNFIAQVQDIDGQRRTREAIRTQAQMLDQIGQAVIATDPEGTIIYTNRFFAELYGWPPGGVLGKNILNVTVPEISQDQGVEIMRDLQKGKKWSGEFRVRRQDGTTFPAGVTNSPLLDDDARLIGVIGVSVDISAQKEAEQAVLRSEREQRHLVGKLETERARLVTAQAVAKVGSWETDLSTLHSTWSDETYRIFEVDLDRKLTHRTFLDEMVHPEDREAVSTAFTRSITEGAPGAIEHRIVLPNGGTKVIDERWRVIRNKGGRAVCASGTAHDITDRKRADAYIREQASMLDEATDAIFVRDLDDRITYWNRSAERLFGWSAAEATSQPVFESLHQDDEEWRRGATERMLTTGHWSGELRKKTRAGAWLTVESRWTLLRDELGEPRAVLAINTDVTERRKLEAEFLRAQRMNGIGTLAGGVAHDLNNLLAPIVMGISVLKRFEKSEKMLRVIGNIESSAARGTNLVKQILSFGRGVEGARIPVRLSDIATEIEAIVVSTFPKNITFEQHVEKDLRLIVGDPTQMSQVVLNLCVNARDAMPAGGRLVVSARNVVIDEHFAALNLGAIPGLYVVLAVSDDGVGMEQEVVDRAFDPFFTTKEMGTGTGLGLSTVAGIVRSHGGFIDVSTEVGAGSTFTIHLPAALDESGGDTTAQPDAQLPARGRGELILIVDDEVSILSITSQTLTAFGYRTLIAEDGAQAIGLFAMHRNEIALVITDMMMPVMDGPALIAALQRIDPAVRIVAVSGLIASDTVARAAAAGVTHFLAKPFTADTMLVVLGDALAAPDLLPAGDIPS